MHRFSVLLMVLALFHAVLMEQVTAAPLCFQAAEEQQATEETTEPPASQSTTDSKSTEPSTDEESKPKKPEPPEEIPFSVQPYEVLISVGFEGSGYADSSVRERVLEDLQYAVQRIYGRLWKTTIRSNDWMVPADENQLQRVSEEEMKGRFSEAEFDKVFLIVLKGDASSQKIALREFDTRVHELTPVSRSQQRDSRAVPNECARMMRDAFRPVFLFVRTFNDEEGHAIAEMQAQGGMILPPDPSATQVLPGDVLRPFRREMERRDPNKLKLLRPFELTYMRVMSVDTEITRGLATTVFLSHLNAASYLGKGRRTQRIALRQRPTADQSVVRLVLQNRPDKPLISHRLALAYQLGYKDEEDGDQTRLVSDRNGEVVISRRDGHPTFWIRVYSGTSLLARVPYAPGLIPFDTVRLPDDSVRLAVEGEIQLLSDELIDAIAQREVLVARAKKLAADGDSDAVTEMFERYEAVPGKDYFLARVSDVKVNASKEADARRLGKKRLEALCDNFKGSVENFFTDDKRLKRLQQIQEIKATAERNKK